VKQTHLVTATSTIWCQVFVQQRPTHHREQKLLYAAQWHHIRPRQSLLLAQTRYPTATGATRSVLERDSKTVLILIKMQTLYQLPQVVRCFEMELAGIKFHNQRK